MTFSDSNSSFKEPAYNWTETERHDSTDLQVCMLKKLDNITYNNTE